MKERGPLLVVVHPGSACGSADFHFGRQAAEACRQLITDRISGWSGHIIVVDGDLSDELPGHPKLQHAIEQGLARAIEAGNTSERLMACDLTDADWPRTVQRAVRQVPASHVVITGAWYHPDGDGGCCNAVHDVVVGIGLTADIDDSALSIDPV